MENISTIHALIGLWPARKDLVCDVQRISPGCDVNLGRVNKWALHGTIPPKYQQAVLLAGRERGFDITADLIVALHSPAKTESDAA